VLPGDTPLVRPGTITELVAFHDAAADAATVLTAKVADPTGYGRVIRAKDGRVSHIAEHADATPDEQAVDEINTSIYCFRIDLLRPALRRLSPDNAQGEFYLTDVVGVLRAAGHAVGAYPVGDPAEVVGVNDRVQLAAAESELRARTNQAWLLAGVTMVDPQRIAIDVTVDLGRDVTLFPGTMLQGATRVGAGSEIGPSARLVDTVVGTDAVVEHTVARSATIGDGARVGPYAVLEPGSNVAAGAVTGPFYTGRTD
jgi:bifunctional UDP-N-acetylglucosamine pyrophosphorylase/glucosamine-1-phosphate N-acetyltransferase